MVSSGVSAAACIIDRQPAQVADAGYRQRNLLRPPRWHRMEDAAALLCTLADGLWLVRGLAAQSSMGDNHAPLDYARP